MHQVKYRRDVPVGVPLDLSTPTGMSCIGKYGENCKSDNVSKHRVLLVAFLLVSQLTNVQSTKSEAGVTVRKKLVSCFTPTCVKTGNACS